ncbi:hypothetical protein N9891_01425, partial [bacterium]|nr:hypothetical protein [bacterium]
LIDGAAGADTFIVDDLIGSGLQSFQIDYGQSTTTNGTRILTEADDDGKEFRSVVPVLVVSNDGAADLLRVEGSDGDDSFTITAAGENDALQAYTIVEVRRAGSVRIDLTNTVRTEGDSLTIDGKNGNDTLDAVGLGATTTNPSTGIEINATDQVAVTLIGGLGNDRLVGTPFADVLNGGLGDDTYTGGDGLDQFFDAGGFDTLVENQDRDIVITDSTFVTGSILGDGTIQILNRLDGFDREEVQQISFSGISGSFRLSYKGATTDLISFDFTPSGDPALVTNTSADDIEAALLQLPSVANVRVTQESVGTNNIWEVAFLGATGQVIPGDASQSATPVGNDSALSASNVSGGTLGIVRVVKDAETVVETQRIVHSGAGGTFTLVYDDGTSTAETAPINWNATAQELQNALNALSGSVAIGTVTVANVPDQENNWLITFNTSADRPQNVLLLRVGENNLEAGGIISSLPTEAELRETAKAVDPTVGIPDAFDRFAGGAIVEDLKNIFEAARITGGLSRNLISVGSSTGVVKVGGNEPITVGSWTKEIIVDNGGLESGVLSEIYAVALSGEDGARISIIDSGGGSGRDELKIFGTAKADTVSASAFGQGGSRTGVLGFHVGDVNASDVLFYRNIELVQIDLGAGDDTILNDDTAATTLINTGDGDDEITVGTVPLIPDTGNRTLEFPEGVPVADVDNLTNGASNELYIYGQGENDRFEVNYNRAPLYLHGGSGDDRFLLRTFLVLRDNPADDQEVTNLANLFGGTGSNRYSYLENGPVAINGGPGIDTLVIVGTPIADTFVITSTVVAGAGRLVSFRGVEALEIDGAGGGDQIYVLSTSEEFTTTIVGGSGDDVIHFGGDHPPLVFDPPEISITPPAIQVESTPQLVYNTVENTRASETFVFQTGWWGGWLSAFFPSINNYLQEVARAAVTNILQARFDASKGNNPNRRNETFSFDVSDPVTRSSGYSFFFGLFQRTEIVVTATNIVERYEEGTFQTTPTVIQPPSFRYDPPAFAFKLPSQFDVGDIAGRVIVEGGNSFESDGDTVIFHNSGGPNLSGLITNREIPRMESIGNGEFQQAVDSNGDPIIDVVVSVEGLGLDIPSAGFVGRDGVRTFGVALQGIETLDLRLADEAPQDNPTASRDDRLIVALTDLRGADTRAGVIGQVSDEDRQELDLRIVAGAGDDIITLQQTTGQTEIFGGAGNDTVTLGQLGSLENIGGGIIFDGDAHIDEVQQVVTSIPTGALPSVFTDLDNIVGTLALVGGGTLQFADRNLQPIVFLDNGEAQVRTISLRSDGEIRTAFVRDYGILAKDNLGRQLYVDAIGEQTIDQFTNGERNQVLWETNFLDPAAVPLFIDSSGVKTDNPNPVIAFDRGGPEINVYRNPNSNVSFNNISLQFSADGVTWFTAGRVNSQRISQSVTNNDDSIDLADIGTYDFFRGGFAARFIRVVGVGASDFRVDGVGVFPESAGQVQLTAEKVFLDNVLASGTNIPAADRPAVAGVGDALFANVGAGDIITYGASGAAIPSVVEVSRSEVVPFTRTVDIRITDPTTTGVDRLIVDGSANVSDLIGALDRYEIGVEEINLDGTISTYAGRTETVLGNGSIVLDGSVSDNYVPKTYFGGETVYRLLNPAQQGLVGAEVITALSDPLNNFRLEALEYEGNEQVYNLFDGAVLFDPFGAELGRKAGDPIEHFQGNPVLHTIGEIQRYLGGEVTLDENGEIVRNGDGSVFQRLPGQAIISDRRDVIYAPDFIDFSFSGNGQSIDLSDETALNLKANQGIDGWNISFQGRGITDNEFDGADRLISVVVSSERGIFALEPSDYSLDATTGVLTITGVDANQVSGDVSVRAHLALTAFHREGDAVRYFGDEAVQAGQPVVDLVGSEYVIRTTTDGTQILYTSDAGLALGDAFELITDSSGDAVTQLRGAPVLNLVGDEWVEVTITRAQQDALTVQRYLGNEALIYFGGEQAYNSASDPILESQVVTRISGLGIPGDIFYTNGIFPDAAGNRVVDQNDVFEINLGDGDDTFTLNFTPSSPFELNTGAGDDRVAVRATEGQTTLNLGSGDDLVAVGSQSGLWETSTLSGRRPSFEPAPDASEFINYLGNLNSINGSVLVNGGAGIDRVDIDDTGDTVGNTGELTSTALTGFGIAAGGGVIYNNDDLVEFVDVALGFGDDVLLVSSTDDALFTRIEGRSGNDTFNIEGTSSATNIYGDSETGQIDVGFRSFDIAPGDDLFRVGSLASDAANRVQGVLGTIDGRLRLFGGGTNDAVDASGNPSVVNSNNQDGDEIIFYNGGGGAGSGALDSDELLGYGMTAGVEYGGIEAVTLRLADARDTLFIAGTHSGTTEVLGGNEIGAGDEINIGAISGPTTVSGGGGDDIIRVNYDQNGVQTFESGVASTLLLKGGNGSDIYEVGLAGLATATVDIEDDSSVGDPGNDRVRIFGNDDDNIFLFRANQLSDLGVVASYEVDENLLPVAGGFIERVNYNSDIELIDVSGRGGDDTFVFDDTLSGITVRGDDGDDTFQLGQVFESARNGLNPSNGLDPIDYFETVQTTRGFLSNGVSQTAVLLGGAGNDNFTIYRNKAEIFAQGEEGDDNFLVRSFVRVDPNDPKAPFTNINGGQGADFISFTVNAPVRIEGGDGFDTLTVVGTEFGDDFVVNEFGVFGGGLFVTYAGIEKLKVDALEGNDRFFISGTAENVEVEIVGGLGSDTFNLGGSDGEPVTVVSNSLDGNSGLIDQSIFSAAEDYRNVFLQDLSVKVSDNDEAGILIIQGGGPLTILEGIDPNAAGVLDDYLVSSYTVVLTRAPEETVRVAATQIDLSETLRRAGAEGIQLSNDPTAEFSANGTTLFFSRENWFIPQTIYVRAAQDDVAEGRQNIQIQHKVTQGGRSEDGGAYDNLASLSVNVEVYDDDVADVLIVPLTPGSLTGSATADTRTLVFENGEQNDTFGVILTRAPLSGETVTLNLGGLEGQATLSTNILQFTDSNFNDPQVVTITGAQDDDNESSHYVRVELELASDRSGFIALTPEDLAQDLRDTIIGAGGLYDAEIDPANSSAVIVSGPGFDLVGDYLAVTGSSGAVTIDLIGSGAAATSFEVALSDELQVGDAFNFDIGGSLVTVVVSADSDGTAVTIGEFVASVVNAINSAATGNIEAENLGSSFQLTDTGNVTFSTTVTRDRNGVNETDVADITAFASYRVTFSGDVKDGDEFSVNIVPDSDRGAQSISYTAGANGEPVDFDRLDIEIADDDTPQIIIDQGNDGVVVSEPSQEIFLGSGFVGELLDIPLAEQGTRHDTAATAQLIPDNFFSASTVPGGGAVLPKATIFGSGDNLADVYKIEIGIENVGQDVFIRLYDGATAGSTSAFNGQVTVVNDVNVNGGAVANLGDSQTFRFSGAGTYYFTVTSDGQSVVSAGDRYTLNLWLPGAEASVAFTGDFGVSELAETDEGNNNIESAQDLDLGKWSVNSNLNIAQATTLPHITINGTGDGENDYYSFEITQAMLDADGAVTGIFDADNSFDFGDQIFWSSRLVIFSPTGDIHAAGSGFSSPTLGGGPADDSFFNDYIETSFTQPGVYTVEVSNAISTEGLPSGVTYQLNVSLEEHEVDSFIFIPEPVLENDSGNNGILLDQNGAVVSANLANIDRLNFTAGGAVDNSNFFTFDDLSVGNSDFADGFVNSSTPYARILGNGDGSYDVYGFQITNDLLNPVAISDSETVEVDAQGPFFNELVLGLNGNVEDGDVWTLGLRHRTYTYTVDTSAVTTLADVAEGILDLLPARYDDSFVDNSNPAQPRLHIKDDNGFNLIGASGQPEGVQQTVQRSGTVTTGTRIELNDGSGDLANLNAADIVFSGSAQAGEEIFARIDGTDYSATVGSTAGALGTAIDALVTAIGSAVDSASRSGNVLSLSDAGGFTLSFRSSADLSGLSLSPQNVTAVDAEDGLVNFSEIQLTIAGTVREGETWNVDFGGGNIASFLIADANDEDALATGLAAAIDGLGGYTSSAAADVITITGSALSVPTMTVTPSGAGAYAATTNASLYLTVPAPTVAEDWTIRILNSAGTAEIGRFEQSVTAGQSAADVAGLLAAGVSGFTDFEAKADGGDLTVLRSDGTAFTMVIDQVQDSVTQTSLTVKEYTFSDTPIAGDKWQLALATGGANITDEVTVPVGGDLEATLQLLADGMNAPNFLIERDGTTLRVIKLDVGNFDLELKITDGSPPPAPPAPPVTPVTTTTALTADVTFAGASLLAYTGGAVPAEAWQLELDGDPADGFEGYGSSSAAALETRIDALLVGLPADFVGQRIGSGTASELLILNETGAFTARISKPLVAMGSATTSQTLTLSGTPNTGVNWTAIFDGETVTNEPASNGQSLTTFSDE